MSIFDISPNRETLITGQYLYKHGWLEVKPNYTTIWELEKDITILSEARGSNITESVSSQLTFKFYSETNSLVINHWTEGLEYSKMFSPKIDRMRWQDQVEQYRDCIGDILTNFIQLKIETVEHFLTVVGALESMLVEQNIEVRKLEISQRDWRNTERML